jgi:hypothetical protein
MAMDWRADLESRQAWAQLAPSIAEWSQAVSSHAAQNLDPGYLPAYDNDVVRQMFRSHGLATSDAGQERTRNGESATANVSRGGENERTARTASRVSPVKEPMLVASSRRIAVARHAAGGVQPRLVANGSGLAPQWSFLTRARPWHPTRVIVLGSNHGDPPAPAEACIESDPSTSGEPPSCRGPPVLKQRRSGRGPAITVGRTAPAPKASPAGDLVVLDDLGQPVPVCAAEVKVIETYLGDLLEELLASSKASSEPKPT